MSRTAPFTYEPFADEHLDSLVDLCRQLSWPSYSEPATARRVLTAPGAVTWVALEGRLVIGLAHLLSDGHVQAHLSLLGVLPGHRRKGVGQHLLREIFRVSGSKWLDLVAEPGSEAFYRSFLHQERTGFRILPGEPPA